MKAPRITLMMVLMAGPLCFMAQSLHAELPETPAAAAQKMKAQESGTKAKIIKYKQGIAEEREGILAANKRLREARKTCDQAQIDQVKKEVDAEVKERKARISTAKDAIEVLQQGKLSIAPGKKGADRSKEYGQQ